MKIHLFLMLWLASLYFVHVSTQRDFCTKFIIDKKEDVRFVTVNLGTPITPYRLLICTNPNIKTMNLYNINLFSTSFGGGIIEQSSSSSNPGSSSTTLPNNGDSEKIFRRGFVTKSVTYSEVLSDAWSSIGRDYLRSIDGTWIDVGIEISNLVDSASIFAAYCNPGGFGDSRITEYDIKFEDFDGFFIIDKNVKLVHDQKTDKGFSVYTISDNFLKYCYTNNKFSESKVSSSSTTSPFLKTKIKSNIQGVVEHSSAVKLSVVDNQLKYISNNHNQQQDPVIDKIPDNHLKFHLDHITLSNSFDFSDSKLTSHIEFNSERIKRQKITRYVSSLYIKDPVRHRFSKLNPMDLWKHAKMDETKNISNSNTTFHIKRSVSSPVSSLSDSLKLVFHLDQPYTYIPNDLYHSYIETKNFVVDIPDEQWEEICFHISRNNSTQFMEICCSGSCMIRQSFLTQKKGGHLSYFPVNNGGSESGTLNSYEQAINLHNTLSGGRPFGNTFIERNTKSLKKTSFSRVHPSTISTLSEDGYLRNSRNRLYSSSHFGTDIGTHDPNTNMNRLNILPHTGDPNVAYIGSSFIFQNTLGVHIVLDHETQDLYMIAKSPTAFELPFLTQNVDINENDFIFYAVLNIIYAIVFIDSMFGIKSIVVHQLFFNVFDIKLDHGKEHDSFYNNYLRNSHEIEASNILILIKHRYLMHNQKRNILTKDVVWYFSHFLLFTVLFIAFGWRGIVAMALGFSSVLSALTLVEHTNNANDVQLIFTVTSIFMLICIGLSIFSFIWVYFVSYSKRIFKTLKRLMFGLDRQIRFDTWISKKPSSDATSHILSTEKDNEKRGDHNTNNNNNNDSNDDSSHSSHTHGDTREVYPNMKNETVSDYLDSQRMAYDIIPYVLTLYTSIIYITCVMYVICLSSLSSFVLRFWNIVGFLILLYMTTYVLLFMIVVSRLLYMTKWISRDAIRSENKQRSISKLKTTMVLHFFIFGIIWILSLVALVFFVLPYEFDSYQIDYSLYPINYVVALVVILLIILTSLEIWEAGWKNMDAFKFSYSTYKTVYQYAHLKTE